MSLSAADNALLQSARDIITLRGKDGIHEVGAALRTKSGLVFSAVHLEAYVGRIAVCAEAVALGMAAADGDTNIAVIVAVNRQGEIVSPCGMCRELVSDYAPDAAVIVLDDDGKPAAIPVSQLLPRKYSREK